MSQVSNRPTLTVALIGNPNTGKSTLFNALAGVRQRVGNYPGVTVEKKIAEMRDGAWRYELIDLPGTYSLAPRSPDEMIAVDVLLGRRDDLRPPDAIICVVDASNLERNLYLVSQVLEMGRPTVIALNMIDVARDRAIHLDVERLGRQIGVPIVELQANRRIGISALKATLGEVVGKAVGAKPNPFPDVFQGEVCALASTLSKANGVAGHSLPRYLVERLLLDTTGYLESALLGAERSDVEEHLQAARSRLAEAGCAVPAIEAMARYEWVSRVLDGAVIHPSERALTLSDRIDRVLTHRLWGTALFALLTVLIFQSVFAWAVPIMDLIDGAFGSMSSVVETAMPPGALRSLLTDGVLAGVGGVLVFLPQIFILFFFIALLEDCGYMARAAYLMDRLMAPVGLSGKSFIPMVSSFACAIPGVMATRVIENRRDRLTTILLAPLMSCSARLPVYTLMIAAFIPDTRYLGGMLGLQGLTMFAMYMVGIVAAVLVALLLKKTLLRGATPPFIMELPSYKMPSLGVWPPGVVWHRVAERCWAFIRRAGTLIVAVSIVVWAALYYPHNADVSQLTAKKQSLHLRLEGLDPRSPQGQDVRDEINEVQTAIAGAYCRTSFLGRLGHSIEPVVKPLGWDWRIGCATMASFPAREVVVATVGVIFNVGTEVDAEDTESTGRLHAALKEATWEGSDRPLFNVPVALSLMVFFALCAQCAATLAVIKRETNSWRWPLFTFSYMTALAYLAAMGTYQIGMWLSTRGDLPWS